MQRLALQRFVVWLAFAGALLVPLSARAAFLPACENREVASIALPVQDAAPPSDMLASSCDGAVDHDDDSRVPAMCDPRGASVIAPPRILPIGDARIDAVRKCAFGSSRPVIGPSPNDSPAHDVSFAIADPAVLAIPDLVPPAPSGEAPPFPAVTGGARPGALRSIERPPC